MNDSRTPVFQRNESLESLLNSLNELLGAVENRAIESIPASVGDHPIIFIMGPHRSGTTLLMQWLASLGIIAYPTNVLSRFYSAPVIGAKIQLMLTDPRFNFKNEILDFTGPISFESENGKTKGALAPNEFWYFWRRFLPSDEIVGLSDDEMRAQVNTHDLVTELKSLTQVFDKPFALKSMILNYNIPFLDSLFEKAIFIEVRRDPVTNVASILDARKRQLGSEKAWYSFKIPEYEQLRDLDPVTQSTRQYQCINRAVLKGMSGVEESRKILVQYEDFCSSPESIFIELVDKLDLGGQGVKYAGPKSFQVTRSSKENRNIEIEKILATPFEF